MPMSRYHHGPVQALRVSAAEVAPALTVNTCAAAVTTLPEAMAAPPQPSP